MVRKKHDKVARMTAPAGPDRKPILARSLPGQEALVNRARNLRDQDDSNRKYRNRKWSELTATERDEVLKNMAVRMGMVRSG